MADEVSHFGQNGENAARSDAAAFRNFGDVSGVACAEKHRQDFRSQQPGGCRASLADELQNATHGLPALFMVVG
jgi:hypothetical protein